MTWGFSYEDELGSPPSNEGLPTAPTTLAMLGNASNGPEGPLPPPPGAPLLPIPLKELDGPPGW